MSVSLFAVSPWDFGSITDLEVDYFRMGAGLHSSFPGIERLSINRIRCDIRAGHLHFPQLRTLVYRPRLLDPLGFFVAPSLELIRFSDYIQDARSSISRYSLTSTLRNNLLRPTIITFDSSIQVDHLATTLDRFPRVKHLSAAIRPLAGTITNDQDTWLYLRGILFRKRNPEPEDKHPLRGNLMNIVEGESTSLVDAMQTREINTKRNSFAYMPDAVTISLKLSDAWVETEGLLYDSLKRTVEERIDSSLEWISYIGTDGV